MDLASSTTAIRAHRMTPGAGCARPPLPVALHAGAPCTPGQTQALNPTLAEAEEGSAAPAQLLLWISLCCLLTASAKGR